MGNYNSIKREEYDNKSSEEIHSLDVVLSSEEIGLVKDDGESNRSNKVGSEFIIDYSNEFMTHEIFKSRDELIRWAHDVGRRNGLVIVVKKSDAATKGEFPESLRPYIQLVKNVDADGNCGFRTIAGLMGFGEDEWLQVRKDLLQELHAHIDHYKSLFGGQERVDELTTTLAYFESNAAYSHWMTMPDMGYLISSFYNIVLFHLSSQQCLTFLPLRTIPMPIASRKEICTGFVNNNHFIQVFLVHGHPVPPIETNWQRSSVVTTEIIEKLGAAGEAVADLKRLFSLAEKFGYSEWIQFDASVVRGLAYYTGTVFEKGFDREGKLRAICGGGRYDRLLSTFGGDDIPACGFGFGDAVIIELLKEKGLIPEIGEQVENIVCHLDPDLQDASAAVATILRVKGQSVDLVLENKPLKWVFKRAARINARRLVLVGSSEWQKESPAIRTKGHITSSRSLAAADHPWTEHQQLADQNISEHQQITNYYFSRSDHQNRTKQNQQVRSPEQIKYRTKLDNRNTEQPMGTEQQKRTYSDQNGAR
ncbi:unnamed protein product [Camellia sinensis]